MASFQQAKDSHAVSCSHIDFSIRDHGRDELIVGEGVAIVCRLRAVVQLVSEVCRVISVENAVSAAVLDDPDDSTRRAVRGNARRAG